MTSKKIITVFGATGAQGGGLAHAILNDAQSDFTVRAVTRNADSDKAKELARLGAEIFTADIDDEASVEKALQGAYGAYFVTFFWAIFRRRRNRKKLELWRMPQKMPAYNMPFGQPLKTHENGCRWMTTACPH